MCGLVYAYEFDLTYVPAYEAVGCLSVFNGQIILFTTLGTMPDICGELANRQEGFQYVTDI